MPWVAARKMKAPPSGLMMENSAGKASRKKLPIFAGKLTQHDASLPGGQACHCRVLAACTAN